MGKCRVLSILLIMGVATLLPLSAQDDTASGAGVSEVVSGDGGSSETLSGADISGTPSGVSEKPGGVSSSTTLSFVFSTIPEAKLSLAQSFVIPFLQGDGSLTRGNNVKADLRAELSPISLNGVAEATWMPIAFLQVVAGGRIGSGWNINLFGGDSRGIGINRPTANNGAEVSGSGFDGLLWAAKLGGAFQFDMAALFPGEWHHIVFRTYHEVNYAGYSRAEKRDSWYFESDDGENRNGFNYYGNYLLGYQMPIFLNTVGLLVEDNRYLYDTPKGDLWGDALDRWVFAALFNFTVTDRLGLATLAQFRTRRTWTDETADHGFYQERRLGSPKRHLEFYRVVAILSVRLR
jgi:hypothetical protein